MALFNRWARKENDVLSFTASRKQRVALSRLAFSSAIDSWRKGSVSVIKEEPTAGRSHRDRKSLVSSVTAVDFAARIQAVKQHGSRIGKNASRSLTSNSALSISDLQ